MKRINSNLIFVLFFIITSILLHHKSYDTFPKGRYALQQSDHYALALGFLDNGFDFFHPSSFSLTHQYPPKETLANCRLSYSSFFCGISNENFRF